MAINLVKEYQKKVAERYFKESLTASAASQEYKFTGAKEISVFSVDTAPIGNYTRNGMSRYGTPEDLTDSLQTMEIKNDKAFTYIIDKGDEAQQYNIKASNRALKREIDERVNPYLDKYNFKEWCAGAGSHVIPASAPNKNSILDIIMDATEQLDEAFAPESGRTMFVKNSAYKLLKECPNFIYTDKLANGAMVKGKIGEIDGMTVKKVPDSYLPSGVFALITHKDALLAPMQLKNYKIHTDPPGLSGDLTEGRFIHDAFVLDAKAKAVCVIANAANCAGNLTVDCGAATGNIAGTFEKAYYTLDGSDPRCSGTRVEINANAANINTVGAVMLRAVAYDSNKVVKWSAEAKDEA